VHEHLGEKRYFGNPFVFLPGRRPTLID